MMVTGSDNTALPEPLQGRHLQNNLLLPGLRVFPLTMTDISSQPLNGCSWHCASSRVWWIVLLHLSMLPERTHFTMKVFLIKPAVKFCYYPCIMSRSHHPLSHCPPSTSIIPSQPKHTHTKSFRIWKKSNAKYDSFSSYPEHLHWHFLNGSLCTETNS